jgi:hypothetical protein
MSQDTKARVVNGPQIGLWFALLALAGCSSNAHPTKFNRAFVDLISTPKANYLVKLSFEDVEPVDFRIEATARYHVTNRSCVAMDMSAAVGGLQLLPEYELKLPVIRTAHSAFDIALSLDSLVDENYFGLGVCNWSLDTVSVGFSNGKARFVSGIGAEDMNVGKPISRYFLVSDLAKSPTPAVAFFGEEAGFYLASMGPQFRIILRSIKVPSKTETIK